MCSDSLGLPFLVFQQQSWGSSYPVVPRPSTTVPIPMANKCQGREKNKQQDLPHFLGPELLYLEEGYPLSELQVPAGPFRPCFCCHEEVAWWLGHERTKKEKERKLGDGPNSKC